MVRTVTMRPAPPRPRDVVWTRRGPARRSRHRSIRRNGRPVGRTGRRSAETPSRTIRRDSVPLCRPLGPALACSASRAEQLRSDREAEGAAVDAIARPARPGCPYRSSAARGLLVRHGPLCPLRGPLPQREARWGRGAALKPCAALPRSAAKRGSCRAPVRGGEAEGVADDATRQGRRLQPVHAPRRKARSPAPTTPLPSRSPGPLVPQAPSCRARSAPFTKPSWLRSAAAKERRS